MMRAFILAGSIVAFSFAADTCSTSDISGLAKCYAAFVGAYGFSMTNVLPHYWDVHQERTSWLNQQGVKIQPKICQIGNALVNCVQPYKCLSQDTYLTLGANTTEAPRWFLDRIVTQYQCVVMSDYYCLAAARDNKAADISYCGTVMKNEIGNGTDYCTAANHAILCEYKIYQNYCDYNAGAFNCGLNEAVYVSLRSNST